MRIFAAFLILCSSTLLSVQQMTQVGSAISDSMIEWSEPRTCGTLNLTSKLTKHCFPTDASRHSVCCVDIQLPAITNLSACNILEQRIRSASKPSSYSWCACTEASCHALGGRVAWILETNGQTLRPLGASLPDPNALSSKSASAAAVNAMEVDGAAAEAIAAREEEVRRLRAEAVTLRRDAFGASDSEEEVLCSQRPASRRPRASSSLQLPRRPLPDSSLLIPLL